MSDTNEKRLREMLNEEKWTRATISNYSINNFKDLDTIIDDARERLEDNELKAVCDEHLSHTKNSIIALYISTIISLSKQLLDDSTLVTLIGIFKDNRKMSIVEHLCLKVLEYGDTRLPLRTLAECYEESGSDEIYSVWERLVKIDYEEAEVAKQLAEKYESEEDFEKAVEYYKRALYRFIHRAQVQPAKYINPVKEVWAKLVSLIPEEIDLFYHMQRKIAAMFGTTRAGLLMQEVYVYYKKNEDWDTAIDILKLILKYDEKDSWARSEITEAFQKKYADHSQLDVCLKRSNLNQSWRNSFEAIAEFEKHIAFDTGNFVFHRSWGVGRISCVTIEDLTIDFAKKRGHTMALKMAVTALQTISKEHIWVLKSTSSRDELVARIKQDIEWALKIIIRSFDNNCDLKKVKQELVPALLTPNEWTSWNTKARKMLKENPIFGINPSNIDFYTVRDRPIPLDEKLSNEFKAQKSFFARVDLLLAFMKTGDTDSDIFREMFNYFDNFLKAFSQVNEHVISSYLVVQQTASQFAHLNPGKQYSFAELYSQIEDPAAVYLAIKSKTLREFFLNNIRKFVPKWSNEFIRLFPVVLSADVIDSLIEAGYVEKMKDAARAYFENYRNYRNAVIWLFKNAREEQWFTEIDIDLERQLIVLIHILDLTFREISNKRNTIENRKINRQVAGILFGKDALLETFILEHDENTITRLYTLVGDIDDLDPAIKMNLRNKILAVHKDFKFFESDEKETVVSGLIVTAHMYDEKKKELKEIIEVRIPKNSKDISFALSLGDLRENSEYKAAKEEQAQLNNTVLRLQEEIDRAQIFDPATVSTVKVSFGTQATLFNTDTNEEEIYILLGPWESDPGNGIISYMSPLGNHLLHHKAGDTLSFEIGDQKKNYELKKIDKASAELLV